MMSLRIAWVLLLVCGQAIAAEMAPVAAPVPGPVERRAKPLVLVFQPMRVTAYNPMGEGSSAARWRASPRAVSKRPSRRPAR